MSDACTPMATLLPRGEPYAACVLALHLSLERAEDGTNSSLSSSGTTPLPQRIRGRPFVTYQPSAPTAGRQADVRPGHVVETELSHEPSERDSRITLDRTPDGRAVDHFGRGRPEGSGGHLLDHSRLPPRMTCPSTVHRRERRGRVRRGCHVGESAALVTMQSRTPAINVGAGP